MYHSVQKVCTPSSSPHHFYMENTLMKANERDVVVIPMNLKQGVFSTTSADNIDVDIKATLLTTPLNGTAAYVDHHPTALNQGESREKKYSIQRNNKLN